MNQGEVYVTHYFKREAGKEPKELEFLTTSDGERFVHSRHSIQFQFFRSELEHLDGLREITQPATINRYQKLYLYPDGSVWMEHKRTREADPARHCICNSVTSAAKYYCPEIRPKTRTTKKRKSI